MKRRTLDIVFSFGAVLLAGLLLTVGVVLTGNANFSKDYVKEQLTQQELTFKTADKLTPAERSFTEARTACLFTFAGQRVTTGKQAECWANEYILGHLRDPNRIEHSDGLSYSKLGTVQADLRAKITAAQASGDPTLKTLEQQLADVTTARETVFKGEMLRGALLTSYGFSVLGEKADQGARVAYMAAAVLALVAIAGFVHALMTPTTKMVAHAEPARHDGDKRLEHV